MKLIDTHAHIYLEHFKEDLEEVIENALDASVSKIYMPNIDLASIDDLLAVEAQYPDTCVATMGLHPCSVNDNYKEVLAEMEKWLEKRTFAAIGEIGTDLYWDKSHYKEQLDALDIQMDWAKQLKRPAIIHCRESLEETIEFVQKAQDGNLRGVFHCFNGTVAQAKQIKNMGFYLGIGGVLTFKNAGVDSVIDEIGLDKIVLETDSPYLAPMPLRGKRNQPAYVKIVAEAIARILDVPLQKVADITTANAEELYA